MTTATVGSWHRDVEQDGVGTAGGREHERVGAAVRDVDGVSTHAEVLLQHGGDMRLVIDYEELAVGHGPWASLYR
jgi:hypothetical protein